MRVLLTGASGCLGPYVIRELLNRGHAVAAWSNLYPHDVCGVNLCSVDLCSADQVKEAFSHSGADVVIHSAALSKPQQCYAAPTRARQVNEHGTATLVELSKQRECRFVLVSTDLVFDGQTGGYRETDTPSPATVYGKTKVVAESLALSYRNVAAVRMSLLYGPHLAGRSSFFDEQINAIGHGRPLTLFHDEWRSPLDLVTAAKGLVVTAESDYCGILHMGGSERLSRLEFGLRLAEYLNCDPAVIAGTSRTTAQTGEPRAKDVSLDSSRWRALSPEVQWPSFEDALMQLGIPHG